MSACQVGTKSAAVRPPPQGHRPPAPVPAPQPGYGQRSLTGRAWLTVHSGQLACCGARVLGNGYVLPSLGGDATHQPNLGVSE